MAVLPKKLYRLVGDHIRALRHDHGLTIARLADAVDLDPGFLGQIERGVGVPSIHTLARIAERLETPLAALFEDPEQPAAKDFLVREVTQLLHRRPPAERRKAVKILKELFRS